MEVNTHSSENLQGVRSDLKSLKDDPKKSDVYTTNYVLIVLQVMQQLGLGPLEDIMQTEAKMMDVTAEIQSDLTTIQQYLTKIENLAHSGGAWKVGKVGVMPSNQPNGMYGPNGMNGLAYNEFHENPSSTNNGGPSGNLGHFYCAGDLKSGTDAFIAAMKDLFESQPCDSGDPLPASNFRQISVNKSSGNGGLTQYIDLASVYKSLNSNNSGWGLIKSFSGESAFSTDSNSRASLIQQYTYYQYKLAAEQYHGEIPNNDPTKLGFSMDPTSTNFDGVGKSLFGILTSFNTKVTASRENESGYESDGLLRLTSDNFLQYIFASNGGAYSYRSDRKDPQSYWGSHRVNILGAFSYAAFNYFWTKNPNASTDQKDNTVPQPAGAKDNSGEHNYNWSTDKGITPDGDKLSIWYSNSQSSSSLISSNSNEASTTMQEYTSEVSQFQNIGQNIVKSSSENGIATIQNFKSG